MRKDTGSTGHDAGQDHSGRDHSGRDHSGQDHSGQDCSGQDCSGMDYAGHDFYCDVAIPRRVALEVVHEDEDVLAYHHTRPFWPVHVVVVPTRHVDSLLTLDDPGLAAKLLGVVQQVAADVVAREGKAGVLTSLGAYQDSQHLHVHVHAGAPLGAGT